MSKTAGADALVLDWFGTIVEFDRELPTVAELIRRAGYSCQDELAEMWLPDAFDGCETPPSEDYLAWRIENLMALMEHCGVSLQYRKPLVAEVLAQDRMRSFRLREGAVDIIRLARARKAKIGICSNWDYPLKEHLQETGLSDLVDASISSCEVGARKPHKRMFESICKELAVPAEKVLYCGDTWSSDIVGAVRAGMSAVWLSPNPSPIRSVRQVSLLRELSPILMAMA